MCPGIARDAFPLRDPDTRGRGGTIRTIPLLFSLVACKQEVAAVPAGGPAVLHRLTETQLDNALGALFVESGLPGVALPPDVAVDGFDNNALTRDATPYLVETLQRQIADVVAPHTAKGV